MSGLREESPSLREDIPGDVASAGLTETDDPGVLAETEDPGVESFATCARTPPRRPATRVM
jgi:hypothetical protein